MTYPFDTTTDDLTDAQIQAASNAIDTGWEVSEVRTSPSSSHGKAIIALARLMRDHPELFEEPVDPLLKEARKIAADVLCLLPDEAEQLGKGDDVFDAALAALKRGMELAKPTEFEWIDWYGGECPVPAGSDCEVRFRCGQNSRCKGPEGWRWVQEGSPGDIVAYRVWP